MADLPWHVGDIATTSGGRALVIEVRDGVPTWHVWLSGDGDGFPANAAPDLSDVGTAARWLRSCAEVVKPPLFGRGPAHLAWFTADLAIQTATSSHFFARFDPAAVARAVAATRAWLEVRDA